MKEDDMDDMMRKAAENYEVDAGKAADWNAVYNAVHDPATKEPPVEKKPKRRFVFWWFLLIPLGWFASTEYNKFKASENTTKKTQPVVEQQLDKPQQPVVENYLTNDSLNTNSITQKNINTKNNPLIEKKLSANDIMQQNNTPLVLNNSLQMPYEAQPFQQKNIETTADRTGENLSLKNKDDLTGDSADKNHHLNIDSTLAQQNNPLPVIRNDSVQQQNAGSSDKLTLIKKTKSKTHYFYAGIIAGGDLSFIKYQHARPLGYNAGILVGYKFNKLSIESGFYLAKKNYYTSGKYFDKTGVPYYWNLEILSVDGNCKMFEIPLNVKYNISEKKKHTWYAGAGLSSYIMNKEFYDYNYIKDGQQKYGSHTYSHAAQNWFSVLNLNAGYELKTGLNTNLRIEPYYKTSLNGVGTGKLSISSAGINVGITRRIP